MSKRWLVVGWGQKGSSFMLASIRAPFHKYDQYVRNSFLSDVEELHDTDLSRCSPSPSSASSDAHELYVLWIRISCQSKQPPKALLLLERKLGKHRSSSIHLSWWRTLTVINIDLHWHTWCIWLHPWVGLLSQIAEEFFYIFYMERYCWFSQVSLQHTLVNVLG